MNATHVSEPALQIPNDPSAASASGNPIRCHHRWPSGRRCRQASEHPNSSFCATHAAIEQNRHNGDRLYDLLQHDNSLLTASEINKSLASLYMLLAEDKISARRAAVLAYISSLMLRSLPAVEKEESPNGTQIILDLPPRETPTPPAAPDLVATVAANDVIPSLPAAGRCSGLPASGGRDLLLSPSPTPTHATTSDVILSNAKDLLFSSSPTPNPTPPQPQPPAVVYHDPNYDDHWFPTAHVIKTAAEIERQRFAPNRESPHEGPGHDARKPACPGGPACAGRPAA